MDDTKREGPRRWTCKEDELLLVEVARGLSTKAIAALHNRTQGAIKSRITKHEFKGQYEDRCGGCHKEDL